MKDMTGKKCKHSSTIMSKKGEDFICNKCGGIVIGDLNDSFNGVEDADLRNELRSELDAEMRMEADDQKEDRAKGDENI